MTDEEVATLLRSAESDRVAIANKRLAANGNPPLEYEVQSSYVLVRLKRSSP